MHYYNFNIKDYSYSTSHLTLEEDATYRRLIDHSYDTEAPISDLKATCRRIRVNEEVAAAILREFFTETDQGWVHSRILSDLEEFKEKLDRAKDAGRKGGLKSAQAKTKQPLDSTTPVAQANVKQTSSKAQAKVNLTNNQEPKTNIPPTPLEVVDVVEVRMDEPIAEPAAGPIPDIAADFETFWNAYPANRRVKKIECQRAWMQTAPHRPPLNELLLILQDHLDSREWKEWIRDNGGKFIPSSLAWISDHRWHDGLTWTKRRALGTAKAQEKASENPVDESNAWAWLQDYCEDPDPTPYAEWPQYLKNEYKKHLKAQEAVA